MMQYTLPRMALSVRQPWAWTLIFAGKDIENRGWRRLNPGLNFRGRVAVHASSGMTRAEYEDVADWIGRRTSVSYPPAHALTRGCIIGEVEIVDVVRRHDSHWFTGPVGLVLRNPIPCVPIPCAGKLGFFEWHEDTACFVPPAKWMQPSTAALVSDGNDLGLFADPRA